MDDYSDDVVPLTGSPDSSSKRRKSILSINSCNRLKPPHAEMFLSVYSQSIECIIKVN
jgi:hypothetical protein